MKKEKIQEFTTRISGANRTTLVVILFDMMEEYLNEAKEFAAKGDWKRYKEEVMKGQACLNELASSLDMQYEVSSRLMALYVEWNRMFIHGAISKKTELLDGIYIGIAHIREAFEQLAKGDNSPVLMGNTQTVYAGLTYGKGTLNENIDIREDGRGFFA